MTHMIHKRNKSYRWLEGRWRQCGDYDLKCGTRRAAWQTWGNRHIDLFCAMEAVLVSPLANGTPSSQQADLHGKAWIQTTWRHLTTFNDLEPSAFRESSFAPKFEHSPGWACRGSWSSLSQAWSKAAFVDRVCCSMEGFIRQDSQLG